MDAVMAAHKRLCESGRSAGQRAWKSGAVAPEGIRQEAARRARRAGKRREGSPRARAHAVLFWGAVFLDAWFAAAYDQADATGDDDLLARLERADRERIGLCP
jgi:hypothetical protein